GVGLVGVAAVTRPGESDHQRLVGGETTAAADMLNGQLAVARAVDHRAADRVGVGAGRVGNTAKPEHSFDYRRAVVPGVDFRCGRGAVGVLIVDVNRRGTGQIDSIEPQPAGTG